MVRSQLRPHGRSSCIGPNDMVQATDVSVSFLVRGELGVPRSVPIVLINVGELIFKLWPKNDLIVKIY